MVSAAERGVAGATLNRNLNCLILLYFVMISKGSLEGGPFLLAVPGLVLALGGPVHGSRHTRSDYISPSIRLSSRKWASGVMLGVKNGAESN